MKRIIAILLLGIVLLTVTSCGKPDNVSELAYDAGCKALQTVDDYLAAKKTAQEANAIVDVMRDKTKGEYLELVGDSHVSIYMTSCSFWLSSIVLDWQLGNDTSNGIEELKEARNKLAESLGK